jgi:hypothetical protein
MGSTWKKNQTVATSMLWMQLLLAHLEECMPLPKNCLHVAGGTLLYFICSKLQGIPRILKSHSILSLIKIIKKTTKIYNIK